MGKISLDRRLEKAVDFIFKSQNGETIKKGIALLNEARNEDVADASFFLACCYYGKCYGYEYSGLEENDEKAKEYLLESIKKGSALGTIGAFRMSLLPVKEIIENMKFESLKEARSIVLELANFGCGFCQYMIGETYYWGDVYVIENITKKDIRIEVQREMKLMCAYWYDKAMGNGIYLGYNNYANMYVTGDAGVPVDYEKYEEILNKASMVDCLKAKFDYATFLFESSKYTQAFELYEEAAEAGFHKAWYYMAELKKKELAKSTFEDMKEIVEYYKNGSDNDDMKCKKEMGILFYKGDWVMQDYEKAFAIFNELSKRKYEDAYPYLGMHYLYGLGTCKNYLQARKYFELSNSSDMSRLGLGMIYANGWGVNENDNKAVVYLQLCADDGNKEAKTALKEFKCSKGEWKKKKHMFTKREFSIDLC